MALEQPRLIEEPTLTVTELCAGIGRALTRAFPEAVWVRGEIANKHRSPQGHVFFDLVDGGGGGDGTGGGERGEGGEGGGRLRVVLWRRDRMVVNQVLRRSGHSVRIDDGTEIRIRAEIGWHPRHGVVRLRMLAIDTAYTLGRLAEARERLVRTLDGEGLLARQARLELAAVPLRVGVVTSGKSAAAADFLETLDASGYRFRVTLVDVRVQGTGAEASVVAGVAAACATITGLDAVCLIRGGGSRTDLATFDRESVARAVAECGVPVLTGIGHETDAAVVDLVAHRSFKTPTACAGFLVERVGGYLAAVDRAWRGIEHRARVALDRVDDRLQRSSGRAEAAARHHLRRAELVVDGAATRLATRPPRLLDAAERSLDTTAARLAGLDPSRLLARGWTLTRLADGRLVRRSAELADGDEIVTTFVDGDVASRVSR